MDGWVDGWILHWLAGGRTDWEEGFCGFVRTREAMKRARGMDKLEHDGLLIRTLENIATLLFLCKLFVFISHVRARFCRHARGLQLCALPTLPLAQDLSGCLSYDGFHSWMPPFKYVVGR